MHDLTLFISSSDEYEDCWKPFFSLLRRHWPACDLPIVLNTENKTFTCDGLKIECTKTGTQRHFGETFRRGLDAVGTENVLLLMIDYFLLGPVETSHLGKAYRIFIEENLDTLYLVELLSIKETVRLREDVQFVTGPGQDRFSFQAGLWKKSTLSRNVLSHETPWLAEQFGSRRFEYTSDRVAYVKKCMEPFQYLHTGVLHKGGWIPEAVPLLEEFEVKLDWNRRGFYKRHKPTLLERLENRRRFAIRELKSRIHLMALARDWRRSSSGSRGSGNAEEKPLR